MAFEYHTLQVTTSPDQEINLTDPMSHDEDDNYDADADADFAWMYRPFSECSVSCGVGKHTTHIHICNIYMYMYRHATTLYTAVIGYAIAFSTKIFVIASHNLR